MGNNYYRIATLPFAPKVAISLFGRTLASNLLADVALGTDGGLTIYVYGSTQPNDYMKVSGVYFTDD